MLKLTLICGSHLTCYIDILPNLSMPTVADMLHLTHLSRHCIVPISRGLARLLFASLTYSFI